MRKLTREEQMDLFVTAMEGGSNYWYNLPYLPKTIKKGKGLSYAENLFNAMMDDDVPLVIYDLEDDDTDSEPLGVITPKEIADGEHRMAEIEPRHYLNIIEEEWDAETADVFLQMVVIGEVRYG